jgi:hypothetical protein
MMYNRDKEKLEMDAQVLDHAINEFVKDNLPAKRVNLATAQISYHADIEPGEGYDLTVKITYDWIGKDTGIIGIARAKQKEFEKLTLPWKLVEVCHDCDTVYYQRVDEVTLDTENKSS